MLFIGSKYPVIGYENPQKPEQGRLNPVEGLWRLGIDYLLGHATGYASRFLSPEDANETNTSRLRIMLGGYLGAIREAKLGKFEADLSRFFPFIAAADDFFDGSSLGEEFYTAEFNGEELPVYVKASGEQGEPSDDLLVENVRVIKRNRCSPYQENDKISPLFRGGFNEPGAELLTNGDYPALLPDPSQAKKWFVRDELDDAQQTGKQLQFENGSYTRVIEGLTIRKYARPTKLQSFGRWGLRKIFYSIYDTVFSAPNYLASKRGDKRIATPLTQYLWGLQYKTVTATTRALTRNPRRNPHNIDQRRGKDKRGKIIKMQQNQQPARRAA